MLYLKGEKVEAKVLSLQIAKPQITNTHIIKNCVRKLQIAY